MLQKSRLVAFIILFGSYCFPVHGQEKASTISSGVADSDKALALSNYARSIAEQNPDSSLLLARQAIQIASHINNNHVYAQCLMDIGWAYFRSGNYDSAKQCISEAKMLLHKYHDTTLEVKAMENLSSIYGYYGDYEPALTQLLAALQLLGNSRGTQYAIAEKLIGIIYRQQGKFAEAKEYLKKAAADFLELDEQNYFADATSSLGNVYLVLDDFDSAIYYYRKSQNINLTQKKLSSIALGYEELGNGFMLKSDTQPIPWTDTALYYYQQAYNIFISLKNKQDIAFERVNLSQVLMKKKQYALAKKYLFDALAEFRSERALGNIYSTLSMLSKLYNETHSYPKAYDMLVQANLYNDTLDRENKNKGIANMLAKYEADKKDRTIALLNTQNTLLKTKKQLAEHNLYKTRLTEFFSLVLIILSAFLTLAIFNRKRIKQRLQEMQLRNRISNDLNNDVGNSMSGILLLSKMAVSDEDNRPRLISKISENAHDVIDKINDIIWTTNPKYDYGDNLRAKVLNHMVPLCQAQGVVLNATIAEAINNIKFPMDTRKNIFLIIKEAINNILKHSRATQIFFSLALRGKEIVLEISENGPGLYTDAIHKENCLETMRSRAESSGGKLLFEPLPDERARLFITIPLTHNQYFKRNMGKKIDTVFKSIFLKGH